MRILEEIFLWIEFLIRNLPGWLGRKIRYFYYKNRLGKCGKNVIIDTGVYIQSPKDVFIGNNVWIDKNVIILAGKIIEGRKILRKKNNDYLFEEGQLHLKDNIHIAPFALIQAHGGVYIGNSSGVASGAKIYSLSHHHSDLLKQSAKIDFAFTPMEKAENQFMILGPVVMKDKTALGLNSVILPGTTIPEATWIGVNTFVSGQKLEPYSTYSTNSASLINKRK